MQQPKGSNVFIALGTLGAILAYLILRYAGGYSRETALIPIFAAYAIGGIPIIIQLARDLYLRKAGSDTLAGISIVTAFVLEEYLAGSVVILMLSGGEALESFALAQASSVLRELSKRIPSTAHKKLPDGNSVTVETSAIEVGDELFVLPHEICPVDGVVIDGYGHMDESYLTGEPFEMSKAPGSLVISGAINGSSAIAIRALRPFRDSRYVQIMKVVEETEHNKPRFRRLGDQLGAWYAPFCLVIAGITWAATGEASRFLAVLVVATPCPLIIGIPVAVIGAISLAARRGIIIRNPGALELLAKCRVMILDKTGTLTTGEPELVEQIISEGFDRRSVLKLTASLERYSKHPLASAIVEAAEKEGIPLGRVDSLEENPGRGLNGVVEKVAVQVTNRKKFALLAPDQVERIPPSAPGLECIVVLDGKYAATLRFRDVPRADSRSFIDHLRKQHGITRVLLVSGDRASEVKYLADEVGIKEVYADQQPEDKVRIVGGEMERAKVVFIGDGINDAPALNLATVGIAFGQSNDVIVGAADAVVMESALPKVDELFHIGMRMRRVALQSAVGGMALSILGMAGAAFGYLTPLAGALVQEGIDITAVLNALRTAYGGKYLSDYKPARNLGKIRPVRAI